jgi:hypothetical protein
MTTGVALAFGFAVAGTQVLAHRPDPAAEPGVQVATVLQLDADAALAAPSGGPVTGQGMVQPDAGQRAARAARVHRVWADGAQAGRLAAVQDLPVQTDQVRFVVTRWDDVSARPHSAHVELVGRYERRASGEAWRAEPDRRWRVELTRGDPVGATRGWRLVSVVSR